MTETRTLHPSSASEASRLPPGRVRAFAVRAVALWPAVTAFVASRLVVLAVLYVSPVLHPGYKRGSFFSDWDAVHYLFIAAHGYPQLHSPGGGFNATAAFFPLLPVLTRALADATGLSLLVSGGLVANAALLAALCVVWSLARDLLGPARAGSAVALVAFWPASFVLSMVYSDGLLLLFAAACLTALIRRRYLIASATGFLAALARPDGVILALCAAWVVIVAARALSNWRGWLAIAGPLAGFGAYMAYLWAAMGTPTAWFQAENRGWHAGFDFGRRWGSDLLIALHHPTTRIDLVASSRAALLPGRLPALPGARRPPSLDRHHRPGGDIRGRDGDADAGGRAHPHDDAMNGSHAGL